MEKASYVTSQILSKKIKPFTDGQLVKKGMVVVTELMFAKKSEQTAVISLLVHYLPWK
jgi:hypothetical protein